MTDRELSKLRRTELLEMLIAQGKEYARLQEQLKEAEQAVQERELAIQEAGTMADAAFRLNDVIGSAQKAVDLYTENVNRLMEQKQQQADAALTEAKVYASQVITDADERSQWLLTAARDQAAHILEAAHAEAKSLLAQARDEAAEIRANAQKEKETILQEARRELDRIHTMGSGADKPAPTPQNIHKSNPNQRAAKKKGK